MFLLVVKPSVRAHGLAVGKPMALAEGLSLHVGCSHSHGLSGTMDGRYLEPGEELPFHKLGVSRKQVEFGIRHYISNPALLPLV